MSRDEIRKKLNEKIPRDAISLREGGSGKKLSYLEGWYVIDRMNEVFGQGNWAYDVSEMRLVREGEIEGYGGKKSYSTHYVAKGRLVVDFGDGIKTEFTDYGYGDGSDKANPGKAHELAVKEAATDAFKRCARNLGMSMGLALYDKTQENVSDDDSPKDASEGYRGASPKQSGPRKADSGRPTQAAPQRVVGSDGANAAPTKEALNAPVAPAVLAGAQRSREEVNTLIKIRDMPGILADLKAKYGKERKEELTDAQATDFLAQLESLLN
jgi:DNA repair and recombination protein RAD52